MASSAQAPPSPSASFYDLSDDEEGEYNTIRHTSSGKGVKLLYTKSKVYVHPTPSSKDNIPGFIALIQQRSSRSASDARPTSSSSSQSVSASSLLLCWIPESSLGDAYDTYVKVDLSDSSSPPRQSYLVPPPPTPSTHSVTPGYAFALPVSEIYSILVRPPSIGWWFGSVVVNSRAGDSFPALFFHDSECQSTIMQRKKLAKENFDPFGDGGGMFWGGDEVLRWLKRYVTVERSGADPSIYLIDPTEEDKKSFGKAIAPRKSTENQAEASSSQQGAKRDGGMDPVTKALKEARWNFLEKLSQVTTFTRRTAQAVADNPKIPPQVRRLIQNPEVQTLQEEFDSARLYLARWAMGIAEQSERERNQRIWTAKDVLAMEESDVGDFEILDMDKMTMADRRKPVTLEEWKGFFDSKGRLQLMPDEVKDRIFHGGLDPDDGVRKEAWLFLLGVYQWESSEEERRAHINSLRDEYIRLKGAWWERMVEGHESLEQEEWWREQKNRIEKDVHRTDRNIPIFTGEDIPHPDPDSPFADVGTNVHLEQMKDMLLTYNEYNKGLGYVQGMSDLLAPIYAVMQDDAVAFWGFVGFMDRMERNFLRDQSGMRKQLLTLDHLVQLMDPKLYLHLQSAESTNFFFFFRMLLVWYKREFEWADVLRLWESLWTDYMSSNFHIFIALAILEKHREIIMAHLKHFDEVLKYVNELSGTMDLESTLVRAESLFKRFQRTVETIDKKGNFPSAPQARQRKPGAASAVDPGRGPQASSSGTDSGKQVSEGEQETRVISPELRALLSRKVEKLDREKILEHGGGVGKLRSRPHSHHKHKRRRRRREMTSFTGPWSSDLDSFKKSVQSMPEQYRSSFATCSKKALDKICDRKALHIWESDSDIDSLLQLTSVIAKLCDLGVRKKKGANAKDGSMLIIAEENSSGSNFDRICELVEYLTCAKPRKHLEGTVTVYSKIVVVRGWDNSVLSGQREALEKTVRRINIAIERVLKMGGFEGKKRKLVWHHNAVIPFLLHWINTTTPALRSSISAITVTGSLDFETGIGPSLAGRANKVADLERLEQYTKKLGVPVVFLDSSSQLINSEYLGTYMYYYAYYINTFLPTCLSRPHLEKAQDELVTFAFRMRAASEAKYRNEAVKLVKKYLDPRTAKAWAHHCINESSYEKPKCRAAGRDESIHHAVQIADCPFARFSATPGVPSFARLAAGPASAASSEYYTAAPVSIAFTKSLFRPCRPATFYLLIPHATHDDEEKVTSRIQGLMMAVLERVRQEKGNPVLGDDEKDMWRNVVKACSWALDGIEDKMPKEMARKVRFVRQKLKAGTWGYAVNAPVADAAGVLQQQPQTVQEMNRPYAFEAGAAVQDPAAAGYAGNQQVPLVNGQTGQGTTYPQQQSNGQLPPPQTVFTHGGVYPSPGLGPTSSLPHRGSGRGFS